MSQIPFCTQIMLSLYDRACMHAGLHSNCSATWHTAVGLAWAMGMHIDVSNMRTLGLTKPLQELSVQSASSRNTLLRDVLLRAL